MQFFTAIKEKLKAFKKWRQHIRYEIKRVLNISFIADRIDDFLDLASAFTRYKHFKLITIITMGVIVAEIILVILFGVPFTLSLSTIITFCISLAWRKYIDDIKAEEKEIAVNNAVLSVYFEECIASIYDLIECVELNQPVAFKLSSKKVYHAVNKISSRDISNSRIGDIIIRQLKEIDISNPDAERDLSALIELLNLARAKIYLDSKNKE